MEARPPKASTSFQVLLEYEGFLSVLKYYVDLNCFFVPPDYRSLWVAIYHHQRLSSMFDLEKKYGFSRKWDKMADQNFTAKQATIEPLLIENLGFYDIFYPIVQKGKHLGTVLSGAFTDKEVSYPSLKSSWTQLSGQSASPENEGFREFTRVALEMPVLEGPTLAAYSEALKLFAHILIYKRSSEAQQRMRELMVGVFAKHMPHSYWMNWALGLPGRQATPTWNIKIQDLDWVRSEIGITRVPTTVITAIPRKSFGRKTDAIEEMLRVYRFQRRSFSFARTLPQTVGGKLENYGAVFVTSPDPAKSRPQRRQQIIEIAERIRKFAAAELEGPVLVGIGESVSPGEVLNESYRQAVLALHLGRQSGKEIVFFNPARAEKTEGPLELRRLLLDLKHQFETASFSGMEAVIDGFLKQVLTLSFQNPEEIRWHLQYGLLLLMEGIKNRTDVREKEARELHESLLQLLERAGTTQEMILAFKEALEKILKLIQGTGVLQASYSVEKIKDYLEGRFREPVRVAKLARLAKVSLSTLGRRFKKTTGVGLEAYLQNLRLSEARKLLKTGSLPISQIAQSCGFKSGSYFIRLFHKKFGITPQKYRINPALFK